MTAQAEAAQQTLYENIYHEYTLATAGQCISHQAASVGSKPRASGNSLLCRLRNQQPEPGLCGHSLNTAWKELKHSLRWHCVLPPLRPKRSGILGRLAASIYSTAASQRSTQRAPPDRSGSSKTQQSRRSTWRCLGALARNCPANSHAVELDHRILGRPEATAKNRFSAHRASHS